MKGHDVILSSGDPARGGKGFTNWGTSWEFFLKLDREFSFTLDAAASWSNNKCNRFITEEMDALSMEHWGEPGQEIIFLNFPYGSSAAKWMEKSWIESQKGSIVVILAPSRTGTKWWHNWVMGRASEVRFIKGRLKFSHPITGHLGAAAAFDSAVIIYRPSGRLIREDHTQSLNLIVKTTFTAMER